jgi:hypothetical protein
VKPLLWELADVIEQNFTIASTHPLTPTVSRHTVNSGFADVQVGCFRL